MKFFEKKKAEKEKYLGELCAAQVWTEHVILDLSYTLYDAKEIKDENAFKRLEKDKQYLQEYVLPAILGAIARS